MQEKQKTENKPPVKRRKQRFPRPAPRLALSKAALSKVRLIAVAYSHVEREWFATEEAYIAEKEVEERAEAVVSCLQDLGLPAKGYPSNQYFLTNLLVDRPDLVVNLVDTLRGKDYLQTTVPGALELADIAYTGAGMRGLVIGNDRNLMKQVLEGNDIPTPAYQYIQRAGTKVNAEMGLPLIVKLNASGGSVGIDNLAVKESVEDAQVKVDEMIRTYREPVIVERFIDGSEVTALVFDDGKKKHVFLGQKVFNIKPDGKHEFTSLESYHEKQAYVYQTVEDPELERKIERLAIKAFQALHFKDYAKFDIRVDALNSTPYFTDCNPNTAFGPSLGLPFTEVLATLYGVKFERLLLSLVSKYAKKIKA